MSYRKSATKYAHKKNDRINRSPSKRANPVLIRAYIYQCRDLPAADDDGSSDPFVKLWDLSGKDKRTRVIYDNVNPLFF